MPAATPPISGLLVDIDGVLVTSWKPLPGAAEALGALRAAGIPLRFATNATTRTRAEVARALDDAGMPTDPDEILSAPAATAAYLRTHHPGARCFLLNSGDLTADLAGIDLVEDGPADLVVIGGAGLSFTHEQLNRAFRLLVDGAAFVAMHRNLYWRTERGLELDTGAYVHALEEATGVSPVVLGKPSADFFATGVAALGVDASEVAMIGDDIENDVLAAQRCGLRGILVRTGKFRPEALERAGGTPDVILASFAAVPDALL